WDAVIGVGRKYHWRHQLSDRGGVMPAYLDFENLDSRAKLWRQPDDILSCGDQTCARMPSVAAQQVDFGSAEPMMVRERTRVGEYGAKPPQRGEEFLRASDPSESQQTLASQPLPGDRRQCGANHRPPDGRTGPFDTSRLHFGAKHDHRVGAGNTAAQVLAQ